MRDLGTRQNIKNTSDKATTIDADTGSTLLNSRLRQEPNVEAMVETVINNALWVDFIALRKINVYCATAGIIEIFWVTSGNLMVRKTLVADDSLAQHIGKEFAPDRPSSDGDVIRVSVPVADPGIFNVHGDVNVTAPG